MADPPARRVVDASVAVRWLVEEDGSEAADALRSFDLHAPALLRIEVGNVLRTLGTHNAMTAAAAATAFDLLLDVPMTWYDPTCDQLRAPLAIALAVEHPIYDCLYLVLAIDLGVPLVTADGRFHRAVSRNADFDGIVTLLGGRASGPAALTAGAGGRSCPLWDHGHDLMVPRFSGHLC